MDDGDPEMNGKQLEVGEPLKVGTDLSSFI